MRIVAGKYRGKKLSSPIDENTRPTLDKTRESIFNIIGNNIYDSTCLDLFAGSGALGIESVSRGAKCVVFNDSHKNAYKIINENVNSLSSLDCEVEIKNKDYKDYLSNCNRKFDIIFLDPPYALKVHNEIIDYMIDNDLVSDNCIFVVETLKEDIINNTKFNKCKEYVYGKSKLTVLWK